MRSNRHSCALLVAVTACALAICVFLWRSRQKKSETAREYAALVMPGPRQESTPAQQRELLEILSRSPDEASPEKPRSGNAGAPRQEKTGVPFLPGAEKKSFPARRRVLVWEAMNHADLDQLLILQEKDVRISKLRKELASLPEQRTRLLRQMEAIKQKAVAAKQEVAGIEKSIRDVEATVETKRAYIGKMKTLQSNTRKNEEYQMCIQEVEKTEAVIDSLETSELELMERLETAKADMAQKIQRARDAQREMEETLARFDRTAETDKELLDHLNAERADLAAAVPEDSLGEYERMTKSKGVPVIVPMDEKGHCGGCHMVITDNARMKVLGGHETVYCDNCHRVLH